MRMTDIDFLIIGAAKSATTWLQQSLQMNPAVCMPEGEPQYFTRRYARGDDWYFSQFPRREGCTIVGEKSNTYLSYPEAAAHISAALPHVKLIAQLRSPVERAYSDYCMLYRRGEASRDIDSQLDPRVGNGNRFLVGGLYYRQIQAYLDRYPREHVLILLYEDMRSDPTTQMVRVHDFLGLPTGADPAYVSFRVKDRAAPDLAPGLRRVLRPLGPVIRPIRATPITRSLRAVLARPPQYPPISADLRARLTEYYAPEVELLSSLLQRDLSGWLKPAATCQPERVA
jgi:hypothetical protein